MGADRQTGFRLRRRRVSLVGREPRYLSHTTRCDVKVCVSYDGGLKHTVVMGADGQTDFRPRRRRVSRVGREPRYLSHTTRCDVRVYVSYDSGPKHTVVMGADRQTFDFAVGECLLSDENLDSYHTQHAVRW